MADISRSEVATLIQEAYSDTLLAAAKQGSTVLSAFQNVNMGTKTTHLPVLATLPEAGWVGESATEVTGVKPQSKVTWADRTLVAEEIAVIIPVHENVIDDATVEVLTEVAELGGQAIGKKLDQAVIFGIDKPASWVSPALLQAAISAGQAVQHVPGTANENDLVGASNQVAEKIATAGWAPDTLLSSLALRYQVANVRDADGNLAFRDNSFLGFNTYFNRNGAWVPESAVAVIADASRVKIGVRQDITVKFLDQATLGTGEDQINLAERDMVALRLKARFAYVLGNSATSVGANKTPVGVVLPAGD
ncbi:major capsid protein [Mycobacterium phage LilPharaoh]|uniref:Major capsid protein n=1 Tax=Mycobacterium phage Amelie TaxID=1913035 RepID=A0A1J0GRB5_9CAUD|nr:major capsid protein [Mycobacterium phage Enkosi]YP_009952527.1 major capsid protein [Mycobacterium phage Amelie]ATN90462.1 major capsid protein [Mycobacterium phage LilPharaoh]AVP42586.1 major capsid protein [Mycobacterium phage SgtBeansprout]AXC37115.1 major capsid protein [Mycobacterium phage Biglebops]QGJ93294.1 major capsid protein [Mycobacterium phage Mdavu]UQS94410.1 major capsid protein [Mycobacterium phage Nutello]UXE03171.1 minor capsid protein [Mycobacterium phage Nikao]